ncbi:hypothetical protein [Mucilaginibacter glaciei]|uniref:Tetratricopeptide repeat protein n=1 Tax=Mucilaginibacter glaciei TaxID=2772109 RepID=A0A926NVD5_9SPHI|nr:hypothetical protein [Mucilaginibacter glaciei]MBD1392419.1 hypothetical protein [Mucilaginibacter glaciei]
MFKKIFFIVAVAIASVNAKAQTADEVYNSYLDFNLARLEGRTGEALELGEQIMPNVAKLTDKARTSYYYSMGNLYENDKQSVKALPLYEKVVAAEPNYYVGQRALAYMYGKKVEELSKKLNASEGAEYKRLYDLYVAQVKKTLPHLEKAQACDPSPETLALIKSFYKFMKDEQSLKTLNARMAVMSKNCIDLLSDK